MSYEKLGTKTTSLAAALLFGLSGCSFESLPDDLELQKPTVDALFNFAESGIVLPGTVTVLRPSTNLDHSESLRSAINEIDFQRENGLLEDLEAPTITTTELVRVDANVRLTGKGSDRIHNDAACDVLNVDTTGLEDPSKAYIIGLNISTGLEDSVFVAWPNSSDGSIGKTALLCFSQREEPVHGVTFGLSDKPR